MGPGAQPDPGLDHKGWVFTIVVAERGLAGTSDRAPIRAGLRTDAEQGQWRTAIERFSVSPRPSHLTTIGADFMPPPGFILAI